MRVKAALCTPILSPENDVIGVIELCKTEDCGVYTMEHLDLVLMVSSWFGNVIFQKEQKAQKSNQFSTTLSLINLSNKVRTVRDEDMMVYDVLDICQFTLKAKAAYYYVYLASEEGLVTEVYEYDKVLPKHQRRRRRLDNTRGMIAGYVAKTHNMLNIGDVALDSRFYTTDPFMSHINLTSVLCREILRKDKPVGILQVLNKANNGVFSKQDEQQFIIISTYLAYLLELIEMRCIKKQNKLLAELLRATVMQHLIPCSSCLIPLTDIIQAPANKMPSMAKSWDWVLESEQEDACNDSTTTVCHMLRNVITPSSLIKHNLHVLFDAFNKMFTSISKETGRCAFYTFHMAFCVLIRNSGMLRLTDKVAVLLIAFLRPFISLQRQLRDEHKVIAHLKNLEYHQVKTVLMFLAVCDQFPHAINRTFGKELKRLVRVIDSGSSFLLPNSSSNLNMTTEDSNKNIKDSAIILQHDLESYLTRRLETELGSDTEGPSTRNEDILRSSHCYLFLKRFNYVMSRIEQDPSILDQFYILLREERKSIEEWDDRFEFVIRFLQEVVRPQLEILVEWFPSCSHVLDLSDTLKIQFERAVAGEPNVNWSFNL